MTALSTANSGWIKGAAYGGLGLPLAFVALPLYVVLPNHYAVQYGIPLAVLGAVLLGARLLDAVADPLIGRWADKLFSRSARNAWLVAALAAVFLAIGFRALFFPAVQGQNALLWWCAGGLAVTYLSFSVMTIIHQSWGARLGGNEAQRARIVAWREGLALVGVLVATIASALRYNGRGPVMIAVAKPSKPWALSNHRTVAATRCCGTPSSARPASKSRDKVRAYPNSAAARPRLTCAESSMPPVRARPMLP